MANIKIVNGCKFATSTTGTSDVVVGSASAGFMVPEDAGVGDGDRVSYTLQEGLNFEVGLGTYDADTDTLTRDTVYLSTNGGSKIALTGNATCMITVMANMFLGVTDAFAFYGTFSFIKFLDSTGLVDANGNELINFGTVASAVNEFKLSNAATAGSPTITVTGGDTNIDLTLSGKGTGGVVAAFKQGTGLAIKDTDSSHNMYLTCGSNLSANRTVTITPGDANRNITLGGDVVLPPTSLADPGADRIAFWDESADTVTWLSLGRGLSISGTTLSGSRETLTGARTYYVRSDGSNSNDGLANTSGGAFLTIQYGIDYITQNIDCGGYTVTLQVGSGTFAGFSVFSGVVGSAASTLSGLIVQGDTTTPTNVVLSSTVTVTGNNAVCRIAGFKVNATGGDGLYCSGLGFISVYGNMNFGVCGGYHMHANVIGCIVVAATAYTISGGAQCHYYAEKCGVIELNTTSVTLQGAPYFSLMYALVTFGYLIHTGCSWTNPNITLSIASPCVLTYTGHNMAANQRFALITSGALPTGVAANTSYYVKTVLTANTFTFSATPGGTEINSSGTQSGTHTIVPAGQRYLAQMNGVIQTGGGGAAYFPGVVAGATATGGQYS